MNILEIPFVQYVGIGQEGNELSLDLSDNLQNHLQTFHAGAQFTLAETASGMFVQKLFPELEGKVVPVLRDVEMK